ncbi:hypothetical protein CO683_00795 [Bradyrhizobium ottawaense]|uniref:hypothetical protein n=1 Tax=Bradyrhizobium ottawaense TaxID=931866 RepID=UPI000BE7B4CF|nr:hypothetical protein [Bradyrhizobium ottawaense]PDT71729.1 hypothetical protein CO683_00795 [Bradyrhizobium ottawaense]
MSALKHIADYLKEHFAGHDTATLMQHFETAIEAKVEEGLAELKQEIASLRDDLMGGRPTAAESEQVMRHTISGSDVAEDDDMPAPAAETGSAA